MIYLYIKQQFFSGMRCIYQFIFYEPLNSLRVTNTFRLNVPKRRSIFVAQTAKPLFASNYRLVFFFTPFRRIRLFGTLGRSWWPEIPSTPRQTIIQGWKTAISLRSKYGSDLQIFLWCWWWWCDLDPILILSFLALQTRLHHWTD